MNNEIEIFDVMSLINTGAKAPILKDKYVELMPVGGLRFLLRRLASSVMCLKDVILCFDSRSFRKDISKDYKSGRKKRFDPNVVAQANFLMEQLSRVGIPYVKVDGMEADDLIYTAVETYYNTTHKITIVSTDYDLVHNIDSNGKVTLESCNSVAISVNMSNANSINKGVCTMFNTQTPYKVFCGDSSDDIKAFVPSSGKPAKTYYENYCDMLLNANIDLNWKVTRNEDILKLYVNEYEKDFTDEDRATLLKRIEIFYPKLVNVEIPLITKTTLNKSNIIDLLRVIKDEDSLRNVGSYLVPASDESIRELKRWGSRVSSGAYSVDNGMTVNAFDSWDDSDVFDVKDF